MVQVLHLMSIDADLQTERTSALIRRMADDGVAITARHVGRGGTYRNAAHAALSLRFGRGIPFDIIHAFDSPSLLAACAAPSPLVFSPSEPPAAVPSWWPGAMVYRNGTLISNGAAMQRRLIRGGVPSPRCEVVAPAIDFQAIGSEPDRSLRSALGVRDGDRLFLAPGESNRSAGHLLALHAVSILHVLDQRIRLLIWGRGSHVSRLQRLARLLHQPHVLVAAEPILGRTIDFESLTGLADAAFVASSQAPPLPIAMCMAAGLPIVSAQALSTLELLEDGRTASLAAKFSPRLLAQRLLQVLEHPGQAQELGVHARLEAVRRFDQRLTVGRFLSLYRRMAGVLPKGQTAHQHWEPALSTG